MFSSGVCVHFRVLTIIAITAPVVLTKEKSKRVLVLVLVHVELTWEQKKKHDQKSFRMNFLLESSFCSYRTTVLLLPGIIVVGVCVGVFVAVVCQTSL